MKALLVVLLALAGNAVMATAQSGPADGSFSFAVLGHVRGNKVGDLNPKLPELLDRVRALQPDFVVLTGDMIWGEVDKDPVDTTAVLKEWHELDSALATLGVPVYRVPGNHDISDIPSRDIYFRLYGEPPDAFDYEGNRFLLLASAWIPEDGDLRHNPFIRTRKLSAVQTDWLRQQLSDTTAYQNAFVFMHHLLWWEPDTSQWWREVHPVLAAGGVDAVFSGDYGPMKFSELKRDGVHYLQSSMEGNPTLGVLHAFESSRMLSSQFDNFFFVTVNGDSVGVEVKTLAEFSSNHFTPEKYRAVTSPDSEEKTLVGRVRRMVTPKRAVAGLLILGAGLVLGFVAGRKRS
ncbi:MAG: metallophosphoesterase family protein [Gemmatimonadales bacterium]